VARQARIEELERGMTILPNDFADMVPKVLWRSLREKSDTESGVCSDWTSTRTGTSISGEPYGVVLVLWRLHGYVAPPAGYI
jgi:hypothetical protein